MNITIYCDHVLSKFFINKIQHSTQYNVYNNVDQGGSVGIATRYGLDGPGIESRRGEIFCTCPDRPWGPPSLLYNRYGVFPGGKVAGVWC